MAHECELRSALSDPAIALVISVVAFFRMLATWAAVGSGCAPGAFRFLEAIDAFAQRRSGKNAQQHAKRCSVCTHTLSGAARRLHRRSRGRGSSSNMGCGSSCIRAGEVAGSMDLLEAECSPLQQHSRQHFPAKTLNFGFIFGQTRALAAVLLQ